MNRDSRGRFKRQFRLSRTTPLVAFAGFLAGIGLTLGFVALGNAYPETEVVEVATSSVVQAPAPEPILAPKLCQEDEIIVGVGDFHSTGLWDEYTCYPLDDLINDYAPEVFERIPYSTLYEVQPGDNLWSLAEATGITLEVAMEFNGGAASRDWNLIHPGELLVLG